MTTVINWRVVEGGEGIKFSSSKRELFKNAIETNNVIAETKSNIKKFSKMGLCDESGELTDRGRVVTLSYMSLDRQCKILGIPIKYIPLNRFGEPETAALEYYKRNGYKGDSTEGGIMQIILYAACFDRLFPLHEEKYKKYDDFGVIYHGDKIVTSAISYSQHFMSFYKYFKELGDELIRIIKNTDINVIKKNYEKILKFQLNESWAYKGNEITKNLAADVYSGLGNITLAEIAKLFFTNPYAYCVGWPDLTIVKDNHVKLVEVKTTDKLKKSQIITINDLKQSTNLDISIAIV